VIHIYCEKNQNKHHKCRVKTDFECECEKRESVRSDRSENLLFGLGLRRLGRLDFRVQPLVKVLSIYKPKINIMATCVSLYPVYVF
jgi:hypothetical protein